MTLRVAPRLPFRRLQKSARGALRMLRLWLALLVSTGGLTGAGFAEDCAHFVQLPRSQVSQSDSVILSARYAGPTRAYPHAVLGDDIEAETLVVRHMITGVPICAHVDAGPNRVFEDTGPRLVDLTGDKVPEVIAVASHASQGARLEIYSLDAQGELTLKAAGPYIGMRFRWLGVVGAADLDGDGKPEIAYVDRPHLAKTLRVWSYNETGLSEIASLPGVSNHKIGWDFIAGGIRRCEEHPEIILADAPWQNIVAVRLMDGALELRKVSPYQGPDSLERALHC